MSLGTVCQKNGRGHQNTAGKKYIPCPCHVKPWELNGRKWQVLIFIKVDELSLWVIILCIPATIDWMIPGQMQAKGINIKFPDKTSILKYCLI